VATRFHVSKRLLIVSPHFPPVNAPDMQRVRVALPYFVEAGWEVTVLTVADPTPLAPLEPELDATVPAAVRVVRTRCFSRTWTGLLGVNNVALRSLPFLFLVGCRLLGGRRYDAVYFSTTMFIVLPLGRLWKMLTGVPYVIDLQDPWISDYYERAGAPRPPGGWKYRFAQGLGRALEGWTLRGAAQLIAVSSAYLDTVRSRYPALRSTPAVELPFGSPDPDLAHLRATLCQRRVLLPAGGVRLAFAGALGPGQIAAVELLFRAVAVVRREGRPISVHFFGTSYDPHARPATLALAARYGLQDCVHEHPGRLRYFDALQLTLEAEANLLIGSTDLAFTPSKILAVLAAGRPVVAIAPTGSAMVQRLEALGQDCLTFPADGPIDGSATAVTARLRALAAGQVPAPKIDRLAGYDARAVAVRQMAILAAAG
jgi:glycosyltransferase involved in cell wall biosynthesis